MWVIPLMIEFTLRKAANDNAPRLVINHNWLIIKETKPDLRKTLFLQDPATKQKSRPFVKEFFIKGKKDHVFHAWRDGLVGPV